MRRRLALTPTARLGFAAAIVLLVGSGIVAVVQHWQALKFGDQAINSLRAMAASESLLGDLVDAETGQRGFLLTGDNSYLEPYQVGVAAVPSDLANLRSLSANNPAIQKQLDAVESLVTAKLDELRQTIELRRQGQTPAALEIVNKNTGRDDMDRIRAALSQLQTEQNKLLQKRLAQRAQDSWLTTLLIALASLGTLGFGLTAALAIEVQGQKRLRAEAASRESEERLRTTLRSIGDAVIATDPGGRIVFMNPVAESLTGWPERDARRLHLDRVFQIVNEQTRATVESPVAKVLRLGVIVGLANHTVLIARDGKEIPIDDSGAPIRDADSEIMGVVLVFRNVSERRQAQLEREELARSEAALRERERATFASMRLAALVEGSEDAIVSKDLEGIVTSWNAGAERLFGYSPDEAIGKHISFLAPPSLPAEMPSILAKIRAGERIQHYETIRRCKDGSIRPVSVSISPIRDADGRVVGASKIARDATEKRRAEREREGLLQDRERLWREAESARQQAVEANRVKDQFLAVLSHELRSPLNALMGWVTLLKMGNLSSDQFQRAVETLERNITLQAQLVNDLLDVSRIISGKLVLEEGPVRLDLVIEECVENCRPAAVAKDIDLQVEVAPLSGVIVGDEKRLQQVITNLLTNSIKFTPRGGRVSIDAHAEGSEACVAVADSGIGIAAEFLPQVFERFRQADASSTRTHGGLGLGLSIVKNVVEMHGGRVVGESPGPGLGSTFTIYLPLQTMQGSDSPAQPFAATHSDDVLNGITALLVDDDSDTRDALRLVLERSGARVEAVSCGEDARRVLAGLQPDVIVSDIGMPSENGYEFIAKMRTSESARIPAIAMTGFASSQDRQAAIDAGFDEHIAKPVDPTVLVGKIRRVVRSA